VTKTSGKQVLKLDNVVREAATAVVKAYDRLDLEEIETVGELDVVCLTFATADGFESADALVQKLAFDNSNLRRDKIAEFERILRVCIIPLRENLEAHSKLQQMSVPSQDTSIRANVESSPAVSVQKFKEIEENFGQLLRQLIDNHRAANVQQFHTIWQQLNQYLAAVDRFRQQISVGCGSSLIPPVTPLRIGNKDIALLSLSMPMRCFLAEGIVGFHGRTR
jgi:hypothetical protein